MSYPEVRFCWGLQLQPIPTETKGAADLRPIGTARRHLSSLSFGLVFRVSRLEAEGFRGFGVLGVWGLGFRA